jgi:hypothetical protein
VDKVLIKVLGTVEHGRYGTFNSLATSRTAGAKGCRLHGVVQTRVCG